MPRLVEVVYECGCRGYGNPDFHCPKHGKYVATMPPSEIAKIDRCVICRRAIKYDDRFSWKKEKSKEVVACHTRCLVESTGWKNGEDGKYKYVAYKESDENHSNFRESVSGKGHFCTSFS